VCNGLFVEIVSWLSVTFNILCRCFQWLSAIVSVINNDGNPYDEIIVFTWRCFSWKYASPVQMNVGKVVVVNSSIIKLSE